MLFGSILNDLVIAFFFGVIGGLGAELVDKKGSIEAPHRVPGHLYDAGVFSNLVVGGIAAWALFFLLETTDPGRFVGASVVAGVGGSATLIAIKEKMLGALKQREAEIQTRNAEEAGEKIVEIVDNLKENLQRTSGVKGILPGEIDALLTDAKATGLSIKRSAEKAKEVLKELQ